MLSSQDVPRRGQLLVVGSGPGHPSLLTVAAYTALTQLADVVLADKLIPESILALIPSHIPIKIARKFPGNADRAQEEMMQEAVEALSKGLCVVRLKQGDPQIYARTAEELLFIRNQVDEPRITIIPGVSSVLAAPTFASMFLTQRGVAGSLSICTGVGRRGKEVRFPGYERGRTTVVLMGVARLRSVISALLEENPESGTTRRAGASYPHYIPIAIIERGSMPDQRIVTSTLRDIISAMETVGEQRPPGMMVIGWAVLGAFGNGSVGTGILDDEESHMDKSELERMDQERVRNWLENNVKWRVEEGIDDTWLDLESKLNILNR